MIFFEVLLSGGRGGGGLLLEGVLRNRSGSAYIWKAFASENEGFAP